MDTKQISPMQRAFKIAAALILACVPLASIGAERYVAAKAAGDGSGASTANAASYLDTAFWRAVNMQVDQEPTTIHFLAGKYHDGSLTLTAIGNERNLLTLRGEGEGAVFDSDGDFLLYLKGCQNLHLQNLHFTGRAAKFGVTVIGLSPERRDAIIPVPAQSMHAETNDYRPARNIDFDGCTWIDLPQVYYGPLCLSFHTDHVTVRNCTFKRCGQERHSHMMYNGGGSHHIFIYNNTFEDSSGTYVRFRDRSDYGYVYNNVFRTTGNYTHEDSSTTAFIEVPLFNSFDPGSESFGTNFQFIGNRFIWPDVPPKRDAQDPVIQVNYHTRDALRFWSDGFETRGYRTLLSKDEGYTMSLGSPSAKRALLLANCGINTDRIAWYGNRFEGAMEHKATYACLTEFGSFAKSRGFDSYADITNALTGNELFLDGFETDVERPAGWKVVQDDGTAVAMRFENAPASDGRRCVLLEDKSSTGQTSLSRKIRPLTGFYFSAWFNFSETTSDHICLGGEGHRWVVAARNGFWENDRGRCISNATYQDNKWYHVEAVMEQGARDYSIWIDGVLISKDIKDPEETVVQSHAGDIYMSPSDGPGVGAMLVDDVRLVALGEENDGVSVQSVDVTGGDTLRIAFSEPLDVQGGVQGKQSALNPLNYQVSDRFFPEYNFTPIGVTRSTPSVVEVKFHEKLPTTGGFLWVTTLRGESGRALSPSGRIVPIKSN